MWGLVYEVPNNKVCNMQNNDDQTKLIGYQSRSNNDLTIGYFFNFFSSKMRAGQLS